MNDANKPDTDDATGKASSGADAAPDNPNKSAPNGPTFTESPDPLAGVRKGASDMLNSMEGKTVSMKTYVGTIIAVVVLMLLARCGG